MIEKSNQALNTLYDKLFIERSSTVITKHISAPGRINIIGEHTDYNYGHILPGAIDKKTYCSGTLTEKDQIYLYSDNFDRMAVINMYDLNKNSDKVRWFDYAKGVVKEYIDRGYDVKPFLAGIYGDVPIGVGVSSSASFEVAVAKLIKELSEIDISNNEMIEIARSAESNFVGVKCGIMDQLSSVMGRKGNVIHVDCMDLSSEYIPFPADDVSIVLVDSMKSHSLTESGYNTRRDECDLLLKEVQKLHPSINTFRDLNHDMLKEVKNNVETHVLNRGIHYLDENERVLMSIDALRTGDIEAVGEMMFASHKSLSEKYEVSTEGLDRLVELAGRVNDICYGSRMMGAGFGGATINLVKKGSEEPFIKNVAVKYAEELGKSSTNTIVCNIGDGAKAEEL